MFEVAPHPGFLKFIIAALALAAALAFLALHWRGRQVTRRAAGWPIVPGVVTISRTARRWGLGNGLWIAGLWYVPEVTYRYEVAGRALTGRHVFLSETGFSKLRQARNVIARYPEGAAVSVHYEPSNPKRACLEPVQREYRALGIAIFLIVIALAALIAG